MNCHHCCVGSAELDVDDGDEFHEFSLVSPDSICVLVEQILEELLAAAAVAAVPTDFDSLDAELWAVTQTIVHFCQYDFLALPADDYSHVSRLENLGCCAFLC